MSLGSGSVGSVSDGGIWEADDAVRVEERVVEEADVNDDCLESLRGIFSYGLVRGRGICWRGMCVACALVLRGAMDLWMTQAGVELTFGA